ncbi:hypothetical protein SDC9_126481 [bioreactor metagenome]|uniref:Uncharacterized protein n=1 Tax=bioreactor metagenome TaxID=1076179 RepID=A0A645CRA6_9ZZZZ
MLSLTASAVQLAGVRSQAELAGHVVCVLVAASGQVHEDVHVLAQRGRHAHGPGQGV